MRPGPVLLLTLLSAVTLVPLGERPAAASCAGPYLAGAEHLTIHPGRRAEISGVGFQNGCQDVGSCSSVPGCSSCDYGPDPTPMRDITLTLRQHGRTWPLGTADAEADADHVGEVTWTVEIPTDARRGWATLVPEQGSPTRVAVR